MPPRPFASILSILPTRAAAAASRILVTRPAQHSQIRNPLPVIYRTMATQATPTGAGNAPSFSSLGIKHTDIKCAPGVELNEQQKVIVGSVLDLFEGHPTLKHFSLWSQNATFTDNITVAQGYNKYTSQFYGLPALFSPIQLQRHTVVNAGNPIEMEMSNKYVVKGIKKEQIMDSLVRIHVGSDGKIEKVEDKWNGKLPDGAISEAFRKLNGVTVPAFVKVPKTEEEDLKMKACRESS